MDDDDWEELFEDYLLMILNQYVFPALHGAKILRAKTFDAVGLITIDRGMVVTMSGGKEFEITIKER